MRVSTIVAILLIPIVGSYAFLRAQPFLFGPTLEVHFPEPQQHISHSFTLRGFTKNSTYLSINDQRIYPDKKGVFEKDLVLPAGYTIVKLYAHNRQKREQVIYLPLYIQPYDTSQKNNNKENEEARRKEKKQKVTQQKTQRHSTAHWKILKQNSAKSPLCEWVSSPAKK